MYWWLYKCVYKNKSCVSLDLVTSFATVRDALQYVNNSLVVEDDWVGNLIPNLTINASKSGKVTIVVTVKGPHTPYSCINHNFLFTCSTSAESGMLQCPVHQLQTLGVQKGKLQHQIGTTLQHQNPNPRMPPKIRLIKKRHILRQNNVNILWTNKYGKQIG